MIGVLATIYEPAAREARNAKYPGAKRRNLSPPMADHCSRGLYPNPTRQRGGSEKALKRYREQGP